MRKWLFCFALLLIGCDGNDVNLVIDPDTGQALNPAGSDWTIRRMVPNSLSDVVWDGQAFIAVGSGGAVLTSVDGIDWVARESATDEDLNKVAFFGSDIFAVGSSVVILSTDHGETWTVRSRLDFPGHVIAASASQLIVTGVVGDMFIPRNAISEDRGATWQEIAGFSWNVRDLIYRDGLFVAPALGWNPGSGRFESYVIVSADGRQWSEILVREDTATLRIIVHDGSQFFVAGDGGTAFSSFDALNWTELSIPLESVVFSGGAWNGTQLILAGGSGGIISSDGGASWKSFRINAGYDGNGIASGNGRFVSVGVAVLSDEGVIVTSD